jgi:hypothetical protein
MFCVYCYHTPACKEVRNLLLCHLCWVTWCQCFTDTRWPNTTSTTFWRCCDHSCGCLGFVLDQYMKFCVLAKPIKKNWPHPAILVMPNELIQFAVCTGGMWDVCVQFSPHLMTCSALGHISCRTRTRWTTWTHHVHATGSAVRVFSPVFVYVASFGPVQMQFFAGASATHVFSSILVLVIHCIYQIALNWIYFTFHRSSHGYNLGYRT